MKTKLLFLSICSAIFILASCSKNEEDPVVKTTYNKDVKPVMMTKCASCHVTGGANPNKFDEYTTTKNKIGAIIDRVSRDAATAGFMPPNGTKLSAETIAILTKWKADGLLEN